MPAVLLLELQTQHIYILHRQHLAARSGFRWTECLELVKIRLEIRTSQQDAKQARVEPRWYWYFLQDCFTNHTTDGLKASNNPSPPKPKSSPASAPLPSSPDGGSGSLVGR
eukprot:CAMPEP_0119468556 /NCGR_PEP_ID=MMETSP1344-20130328/2261_1 /TAXON_ID=236787 /ORGANISM="Florenciella parvula, Strain CCMP2471" /LENGTH=110 /DNA_ID=CAMNT_0007501037 /DNA_START=522 /DNA_END=855 /DNA_ORIENTATION=-